jgi:hypothetical protein
MALIYGAVAGFFRILWGIFRLGEDTGGLLGAANGIQAFFWTMFMAMLLLFVGAVITLVVSAICGGNTRYEANLRVTASLMVLLPVFAFVGFLSGINFYLGLFFNMLLNLYGLYLFYHALVAALKGTEMNSKIITILLASLLVIFTLISIATRKAANRFLDDIMFDTEKFEDEMDDMNRDMGKKLEELQEELDDLEEQPDTLQQ